MSEAANAEVPIIETNRLVLRGWRPTDREPFAALNADARVMEHFPVPLTRAESDALADRITTHLVTKGWGLWAVERRAGGAFIGFTGLAEVTFDALFGPAIEVGWRLARDAWGFGYATEGARAALRFGFQQLGLEEIVSFTSPRNVRSVAVMERLGMTRDPADDFDHPRVPVGNPLRRHVLYRLRRTDWRATAGPESTT
ncbi:MAG: GNAT family N-acetyltransferase [Chloroflexota bacterium]